MGQVYNHLSREGKTYGYLVNAPRSWLTVKSDILAVEAKRVLGDEVNITTKRSTPLRDRIGYQEFKGQCLSGNSTWMDR